METNGLDYGLEHPEQAVGCNRCTRSTRQLLFAREEGHSQAGKVP